MKRSVWAIVLCWGTVFSAGAVPGTDWHLYPTTCVGGTADVEVACGTHGRYLIGQAVAPAGCTAIAEGDGNETVAQAYPPEAVEGIFPFRATRLREVVVQAPQAASLSLKTTGARSGGLLATALPAPGTPPPSERWVAVLDFESAHGDSTTWLADQVAGTAVAAHLVPLDPPELVA